MHLGLAAETIGESCHFPLNSEGTGLGPEIYPISSLLVVFADKMQGSSKKPASVKILQCPGISTRGYQVDF